MILSSLLTPIATVTIALSIWNNKHGKFIADNQCWCRLLLLVELAQFTPRVTVNQSVTFEAFMPLRVYLRVLFLSFDISLNKKSLCLEVSTPVSIG